MQAQSPPGAFIGQRSGRESQARFSPGALPLSWSRHWSHRSPPANLSSRCCPPRVFGGIMSSATLSGLQHHAGLPRSSRFYPCQLEKDEISSLTPPSPFSPFGIKEGRCGKYPNYRSALSSVAPLPVTSSETPPPSDVGRLQNVFGANLSVSISFSSSSHWPSPVLSVRRGPMEPYLYPPTPGLSR